MERPWQWPGQGRPRVLTSSVGRCGQMICRGSASSFYVLKDIYFHHYSFFQEQYLDHREIEPAYSRRMHELIDPEEKIHQNICLTKLDDFLASGVIDDECLKIFKFLRAGVEPKDIIKELNINHNEKYRRREKNCFKKYRFM